MNSEVLAVDMTGSDIIGAEVTDDAVRRERQRAKTSCEPKCLLPDSVRHIDGIGPPVDLDDCRGKLLVVTLGVNAVVERTGLTVSVWGSPDRIEWGTKPLVSLRQRQYCGVYSALLNLAQRPNVRCLRVEWNITRLGKIERIAQFGFEVFVEESGARVSSFVCA